MIESGEGRIIALFTEPSLEVVSGFAPQVSGHILVKAAAPGVKQQPPLPVSVELAPGASADACLAEAIRERLRELLVPPGSLGRSEYKSKLVDH